MKIIISNVLSLSIGIASGIFITKEYFKKKYQTISDDEIESIKSFINKAKEKSSKIVKDEKSNFTKEEDYAEHKNYIDYTKKYSGVEEEIRFAVDKNTKECSANSEMKKDSYTILSSEEFQESTNSVLTLFYFTDHILTDEEYNIIDDDNSYMINKETLISIIYHNDDADCIYVRNNDSEVDYEVLFDERSYYSLKKGNPKRKLAKTINHAESEKDNKEENG